MTPLMEQYQKLKKENPDCILFFRLGDFYEMFEDDALLVSPILGITLTKRGSSPMCGVPHHSVFMHIDRLLQKGYKVALSEQDDDKFESKTLMGRSVVRIYTPGTKIEEELIKDENESFIASVFKDGKGSFEIVLCDVSRGILLYKHAADKDSLEYELYVRKIDEFIVLDDDYFDNISDFRDFVDSFQANVNKYPASVLNRDWTAREIEAKMEIKDAESIFSPNDFSCWNALCLMVRFLKEISVFDRICFNEIHNLDTLRYLQMSRSTISALELVQGSVLSRAGNSLYSTLDNTVTAMGSRMLKSAVLQPLLDRDEIEFRLDKVEWLTKREENRRDIKNSFRNICDLERAAQRLKNPKVSVNELLNIARSIDAFFAVAQRCSDFFDSFLSAFKSGEISDVKKLSNTISCAVENNADSDYLIKNGFDDELDRLRSITADGDGRLKAYIDEQKEKYGITNMRLAFSGAFGYSIEVSKGNVSKVPAEWQIRQSLVNCSRYVNDDFLQLEREKINAEQFEREKEKEIFQHIVYLALKERETITAVSKIAGYVDVLYSFAESAVKNNYVRPVISERNAINVQNGRHPVVEKSLHFEFVANDLALDSEKTTALLLTGPNMAGKSTYLRQNAIIIIMAQMGSFVPASFCETGIFTRIFSRIGSADNISEGESTFYTEMKETAAILRTADENSFVIMDEIGRGTSAKDGCAIAEAVFQFIAEKRIKCLFATHYIELTQLASVYPNSDNITLEVDEKGKNIVFLRKVRPGIASSSYALHAARLAGVPASVIAAAEKNKRKKQGEILQNTLFELNSDSSDGSAEVNELREKIASFDIDNSTPVQALQFISSLKESIDD